MSKKTLDGYIEPYEALSTLKKLIEEEDLYYYKILLNKQELSYEYDSVDVTEICELTVDLINDYLRNNDILGYCVDEYDGVLIC